MPKILLELSPEQHMRLKIYAAHRNKSMSDVLRDAIPEDIEMPETFTDDNTHETKNDETV